MLKLLMEAKHKTKAAEKRAQDSSSEDEALSDFEDIAPRVITTAAPVVQKQYYTPENTSERLMVVLDNCSLETAKTKRGYELLSADEHSWLLRKKKRDPEELRPDLVHQCLLALFDSVLAKKERLQVVLRT